MDKGCDKQIFDGLMSLVKQVCMEKSGEVLDFNEDGAKIFNGLVHLGWDIPEELVLKSCSDGLCCKKLDRETFSRELRMYWERAFDLFDMFVSVSAYFRELIINEESALRGELRSAMVQLHARACLIADEVLVLMRNGFPDGAYARWRTLYEISVVMMFLEKHGEKSALLYNAWKAVHDEKLKRKYDLCWKDLGWTEPDSGFVEDARKKAKDVLSRAGDNSDGDYGWAASQLKIKKPNFSHLEKDVGLERFRVSYSVASDNVHANVRGCTDGLSRYYCDGVCPSFAGFVEPGEHTVDSLLMANNALMSLKKGNETGIQICVALKLREIVCAALKKSQKLVMDSRISL